MPALRLETLETREVASATTVSPPTDPTRDPAAPADIGTPTDDTAARKPYPNDKIAIPPG